MSSIELTANYVEGGEALFITTVWQNSGAPGAPGVKIAADFVYDKSQRYPENAPDGYRTSWTPYPRADAWIYGTAISSTGRFNVPENVWCGPFRVVISLIGENGQTLPFTGRNGRTVFSEDVGKIDIGWGWGHRMLVEQRRPVRTEINPLFPEPEGRAPATVPAGCLTLCADQPSSPVSPGGISVRISDAEAHTAFSVAMSSGKLRISPAARMGSSLVYHFSCDFCSADLVFYCPDDRETLISVDNVVERSGYILCGVYIPHLVSVGENGELYNFFGGGRSVRVKDSLTLGACFRYDSNCAVACSDGDTGISVTADDMDGVLYQSVELCRGEKRGFIGCGITLTLPSFSENAEPVKIPRVPIRVTRLPGGGWFPFAERLRARLPDGMGKLYENTLIYKISADKSFEYDENRPITYSNTVDFTEVKSIIERVYNLSNGMKQVVYLVGWQRRGHDTEYPNPHLYGFSPALGTFDEWLECLDFAKKHNAVLSFHNNFDDAYNLEGLDPSLIATDRRGEKRTGWLWAGGMSRILSPKAYCESGEMAKRVKKTLGTFRIETSYHLDVLSAEIRRYDYSRKYVSSALENIGYKKSVIDEFAKYGVDVTSENVSEPFVGKLEYALHTKYDFSAVLFPGEKLIPLTTCVYHGKIRYSMGSLDDSGRVRAVAVGAVSGFDCLGAKLGDGVKKSLFLHAMPMQFLADREVSCCEWNGTGALINYGEDSFVSVDFATGNYTVRVNGMDVVKDGLAVIPCGEKNSFILFSDREKTVEFHAAEGVPSATLLDFKGTKKPYPLYVGGENVGVNLSPCVPVLIKNVSL
ncbi:MAG: hypothetical protein IJU75_03675 [Clostridia bacterium]|nr:hypothetical protein [Clostridia bacterium]